MATEPYDLDPQRRSRPDFDAQTLYPFEEQQARGGFANGRVQGVARALGWFSVGLGIAEVVAPKAVAKLIGVRPRSTLFRALGAREIATGLGILSRRMQAPWVGARVIGDVMDLSLLVFAFGARRSNPVRLATATAAVLGVTALDALCTRELSRGSARAAAAGEHVNVRRSVTVNRSPEECYQFFRNLENLPRFMKHVEAVRVLDSTRSHWIVKGPAGAVEWDSQITEDRPNESIAWRTLGQADVPNSGWVKFEPAPGRRGTIIRACLEYTPPAGRLGVFAAKLFGEDPGRQVREDLRRFKQVLETGEVPTTRGQSAGRRSFFGRTLRRGERYEG